MNRTVRKRPNFHWARKKEIRRILNLDEISSTKNVTSVSGIVPVVLGPYVSENQGVQLGNLINEILQMVDTMVDSTETANDYTSNLLKLLYS